MITGTYQELCVLHRLIKELSDCLIPRDDGKPNDLEATCFIKLELLREAREFLITNFNS